MVHAENSTGLGAVLVIALFVASCGTTEEEPVASTIPPSNTSEAVQTYAQIVLANYEDSLAEAQKMDEALDALIADPTQANLNTAREAWLASREPYLQTEVFRFYDGPIDNPDDGPEGLLNAWPMDENYIDYVQNDAETGVINDAGATISAEELEGLNEQGGEKNIATGYHALEFVLWGQDLSADGPGDRPFSDFVSGEEGTAANQDRRRMYLKVTSELLLGNLQTLVDAWNTDGGNYREEFEGVSDTEALRRILTGMIVLSGFETGGERLQTALDSGDQEDEHSCFSDNTHRDMVQDVVGVQNVWEGSYTRTDGSKVSGTGIRAVVAAVDQDLADRLDAKIEESVAAANALEPPFDNEIAVGNTEGRARVQALISSLRDQESLLEEVFMKFNLTIPETE